MQLPRLSCKEGRRQGRDGTLGNSRKGVKGKVCVAADPTKKQSSNSSVNLLTRLAFCALSRQLC